MHGTHNEALVFLALLIAGATSYTALDLAGRAGAATSRVARMVWISGAAFSLGGGTWSMHFVAMLAHSLPGMQPSYALGLTVLSFLLAVCGTGAGFVIVSKWQQRMKALLLSGPLMGMGIAAMHYTGMAALKIPMRAIYDPVWVGVSLLIAISAATAALWLALMNKGHVEKFIAAVVMGAAISGMHFAGMRAVMYAPLPGVRTSVAPSVNNESLAIGISAITFTILALALMAAVFDRRLAQQSQREAELLRNSEERFRSFYRRTPLPLHAVDQEERIIDVSDAWLTLLGYERSEVVGLPLRAFMTPDSARQRAESTWPLLLQAGEARGVEANLVARDGRVIDVEITSQIEREVNGEFQSCVEGVVDVTARKEAENALRQTQKMEMLGQLTGGVAHDFNNLLSIILGNLELLQKRTTADERSRQLIDTAIQGVQRGATLVQRMLAFARRQSLDPQPVDVVALMRGMMDLLQRSLGPQHELLLPEEGVIAVADVDENQLEMALLNLVVNARDAMPDGGAIKILVDHVKEIGKDDQIAIEVIDHGGGMDPATLARATEPFFTTKGPSKGTGLGLPMVHGFAAQSGGQLRIASQPGEGTKATIILPAAQGTAPALRNRPAPSEPVAHRARTAVILAVDDDFLLLMNLQAMLEDMGHRVLTAHNGEDALRVLSQAAEVDLVITDQAMPKMNGSQLAEAIKVTRPSLPIILATGYAQLPADHSNVALKLDKPYFQSQLEQAVMEVLHMQSERDASAFKSAAG